MTQKVSLDVTGDIILALLILLWVNRCVPINIHVEHSEDVKQEQKP